MKPQLEPVCGHLPLPKENKVTASGLNVVFLETSVAFMGITSLHTKCNKTGGFDVSLYKADVSKRDERGLSATLSHGEVVVGFNCDGKVNTHEIYLHNRSR